MTLFWKSKKTELTLDDISYEIQHFKNDNVKTVLTKIGIDSEDEFGRTALIWASFAENIELMKWLIENKANINHQDKNGYCALHFVAQEKRLRAAEYLLSIGAKTELKDKYLNTPIWTAIFNSKNDLSILELLIKNKANLDNLNSSNKTPREMAEKILGEEFKELKEKLNIK
jgi:ankyrin repeat protein